MTDLLHRTLSDRAARAAGGPSVEEMLRLVEQRAGLRRHRRRTGLAAGASSLVVLALVVTGSVVLTRDTAPHSGNRPGQRTAATTLRGTGPSSATQSPVPEGLVTVAPAPVAAEASLGLVPAGWRYEAYSQAVTTYIAAGATPSSPDSFVGKIAVIVGQRYAAASSYSLTVGGHRVRYDGSPDGPGVGVLVPDRGGVPLEVVIQFPPAARVTREQALAMAGSLDVRSTVHYAVG